MDNVFFEWLDSHRDVALALVPLIAFLEAFVGVGLLVSGVILLSVCTLLYVDGAATLAQMLPLACLGATVSDHCGYYIGRIAGPGFHRTRFAATRRASLERAEAMFRRYGDFAIVVGRLVPAIRSIVPLLSGVSGITRARYTAMDLLACAIWTAGLGVLVAGIDRLF